MDERTLLVELLSKLLAVNSVSDRSNAPLADLLEADLRALGYRVSRQDVDQHGVHKVNLLAAIGPATEEALIFCGHMDTVPPGDTALWTATGGDPWLPTVTDGKVYGLGASDLKGGIACMLALARELPAWHLDRQVYFLLTFDEEVGLLGARAFLDAGWLDPAGKHLVLVEPTYNKVVLAEKGYLAVDVRLAVTGGPAPMGWTWWRVRVPGKEAHSGRTHQGDNAIVKAGRLLEGLALSGLPVSLADVRGGVARNSVAGSCDLVIGASADHLPDVVSATAAFSSIVPTVVVESLPADRLPGTTLIDGAERFAQLVDALADYEAHLKTLGSDPAFDPPWCPFNIGIIAPEHRQHDDRALILQVDSRPIPAQSTQAMCQRLLTALDTLPLPLTCSVIFDDIEPFAAAEDSAFRTRFQDLHDPMGKPAYTEAGAFAPAGYDCAIIGPGNTLIHRPNEMIEIDAMVTGLEVYRRVVRELCLNPPLT